MNQMTVIFGFSVGRTATLSSLPALTTGLGPTKPSALAALTVAGSNLGTDTDEGRPTRRSPPSAAAARGKATCQRLRRLVARWISPA